MEGAKEKVASGGRIVKDKTITAGKKVKNTLGFSSEKTLKKSANSTPNEISTNKPKKVDNSLNHEYHDNTSNINSDRKPSADNSISAETEKT